MVAKNSGSFSNERRFVIEGYWFERAPMSMDIITCTDLIDWHLSYVDILSTMDTFQWIKECSYMTSLTVLTCDESSPLSWDEFHYNKAEVLVWCEYHFSSMCRTTLKLISSAWKPTCVQGLEPRNKGKEVWSKVIPAHVDDSFDGIYVCEETSWWGIEMYCTELHWQSSTAFTSTTRVEEFHLQVLYLCVCVGGGGGGEVRVNYEMDFWIKLPSIFYNWHF